ncbi:MAG: type IX secretion system outer membrane channel protein PorV [Flavipsychrobacter sp.]|nr:type IX secretion system outer membrane channel protein PorV [Flavipsychrobacter sp.]
MAKRFALVGLGLIAGLSFNEALAQNSTSKVNLDGSVRTITTAVPFLRISPDARSGAMGDVGVAISPDANAQFWNVAKMPFASKKYGVSMTYTPWLKDLVPDIWLGYISGYAKFGEEDNQAVSASLRYFNLGDITYTDINAQTIGTGKPREFSFDLGYSRRLSPYLSTGLSLRYIYSGIATGVVSGASYKAGNAFAADLGIYYNKTTELDGGRANTLAIGAILTNVGSKISYSANVRDFIPMNLGLGAAYTYQADEYNKVTFALDLNKLLVPSPQVDTAGNLYYPRDKGVVSGMFGSFGDAPGGGGEELREIQISAGLEYWYQEQFAVRAGYFYEDKTKGDRKYFTCGVGVKYNVFNINVAYLVPSGSGINRNPLSNTLRFTLMFELDKIESSN